MIKERQEAFNFILNQSELAAVAVGMKSIPEVELNVKVFGGLEPTPDDYKQVDLINRRVHIEEWCQGCNQCVERCKSKALESLDGRVTVNSKKCVLCGYCGSVCPDFCIKII